MNISIKTTRKPHAYRPSCAAFFFHFQFYLSLCISVRCTGSPTFFAGSWQDPFCPSAKRHYHYPDTGSFALGSKQSARIERRGTCSVILPVLPYSGGTYRCRQNHLYARLSHSMGMAAARCAAGLFPACLLVKKSVPRTVECGKQSDCFDEQ